MMASFTLIVVQVADAENMELKQKPLMKPNHVPNVLVVNIQKWKVLPPLVIA